MFSNKYNIILASGSPRRQELLKDLDIPFTIEVREVEEIFPVELKSYEITDFLAELKAAAFDKGIGDNDLILTSDTIVWCNEKALGKPKNYQEAHAMLSNLSGRKHEVITSVCLKTKDFVKTINDTVTVYFKDLTNQEIEYYINEYKPFDKAGAYGIQEWIGKIGITRIEGSYFTVMGLPLQKLYKELVKL